MCPIGKNDKTRLKNTVSWAYRANIQYGGEKVVQSMFQDLTERKRLLEQIYRAESSEE